LRNATNLPVCVKIVVLTPIICPFEPSKGPPLHEVHQNTWLATCFVIPCVEESIVPEI